MNCQGVNSDGSPCGAPEQFIGASGLCWKHDPEKREESLAAARKGSKMSARKSAQRKGLDEGELPRLDSPSNAARWCQVIGEAVLLGRITPPQAQAGMRAISEFLRAHDARAVADRLEKLQQQVRELRAGKNPASIHRVK